MEKAPAPLVLLWETLHSEEKAFVEFSQKFKTLPNDVIIDASNQSELLETDLLTQLIALIDSYAKTLVLIFPSDHFHEMDTQRWNVVPTIVEAQDFIDFERMQRDLGF